MGPGVGVRAFLGGITCIALLSIEYLLYCHYQQTQSTCWGSIFLRKMIDYIPYNIIFYVFQKWETNVKYIFRIDNLKLSHYQTTNSIYEGW